MSTIIPTNQEMLFASYTSGCSDSVPFPEVLAEADSREKALQRRTDITNPSFTEESLIKEMQDGRINTISASKIALASAGTAYTASKVVELVYTPPEVPMYIYVGARRSYILNPALETIEYVKKGLPMAVSFGFSVASLAYFLYERSQKLNPGLLDAYAKGAGIGKLRIARLNKKIETIKGLHDSEVDPTKKTYLKKCHDSMKEVYKRIVKDREEQSNEYTTGFFFKRRYAFSETGTLCDGSPCSFSALKSSH